MELRPLFINHHNELRPGWQLAAYLVLLAIIAAPALFGVQVLIGWRGQFSGALVALAAALVAGVVAVRLLNRKPVAALGLPVNGVTMRHLGIGCLAGFLMMTGIFGIEYVLGYVKVVASEMTTVQAVSAAGFALLFFGVAAMFEELVFRGYPFQTLARGIGFIPAVAVFALLFGAAHLGNPNASAFGFINTVLVSGLLCLAYWRTRNLWLPFGLHFAWNYSQTTLYGFPTSGHHFADHELTRLTQYGPEWITGGAYGPEAGSLATLAILACGVYVYFSRSLRPHEAVATLEREGEKIRFEVPERRLAA